MGFVKIHRDIQNHWLWTDKPFARGQAWIDLLVMTNYAEGDILSKGNLVHLERGQVFRSIGYLSERWGWNKKKVRKFLEVLERDKMVTTKGLANGTLITIENYARWNDEGSAEGSAEGTPRGHVGVTKGSQKEKNKKKEKKEKKINIDIYSQECSEIVSFLNEMCGTSYRASSKKTKDLIHARLNEGFTVEDFRTVIYRKGKQWMNDPKMCKFLRPETLFSNKFEGYLNEKDASQSSISRWEVDF